MFFFFFSPDEIENVDPSIYSLFEVLRSVCVLRPQMTLLEFSTFLYLAIEQKRIWHDKISGQEISFYLQIPYTTYCRHLDILGEGLPRQEGLGLIEKCMTQDNKKLRLIKITNKGSRLLQDISRNLSMHLTENMSDPLIEQK